MRCRWAISLSLDSPKDCTATPKDSPRLATSTALPVTSAATSVSLPVSASTFSVNCVPTRSSMSADEATSASTAVRCSAAVWLTASSKVPSVSSRRLRSSSMSLSRTMLSDSFWRSSPMTSAAARGASDAACTRRPISAIVSLACACVWDVMSCAVRFRVSQISCCWRAVFAPASSHSARSASAIAASLPVQASRRASSCAASPA
ncbi:hypothetical protein D3C72_1599150 [compost metagenome]